MRLLFNGGDIRVCETEADHVKADAEKRALVRESIAFLEREGYTVTKPDTTEEGG